jgi:SAM-dependent methyltransferase
VRAFAGLFGEPRDAMAKSTKKSRSGTASGSKAASQRKAASASSRRTRPAPPRPRRRAQPATRPMKMYEEIASWWPLLSAPADYEEEGTFYVRALVEGCARKPRTLLELGSGGGNNASFMKGSFEEVVLVDLSPGMLAVSRELNPDCEHVVGDMRTVRLGRTFDCVFVHDAVTYMASEHDLRQAMETAFVHCNPGGVVLFCPDHLRETWRGDSDDHGGHDAETGRRGMRYLEWAWDPDPNDSTYTVDYAYLLRGDDGSIRVEHDRHLEGLFSRTDWLRWLEEAGFRAERVSFDHSELEPGSYELFRGRK